MNEIQEKGLCTMLKIIIVLSRKIKTLEPDLMECWIREFTLFRSYIYNESVTHPIHIEHNRLLGKPRSFYPIIGCFLVTAEDPF